MPIYRLFADMPPARAVARGAHDWAAVVARMERSDIRAAVPHVAELVLGLAEGETRGLNAGYELQRIHDESRTSFSPRLLTPASNLCTNGVDPAAVLR